MNDQFLLKVSEVGTLPLGRRRASRFFLLCS